jgi:hypothetical protein
MTNLIYGISQTFFKSLVEKENIGVVEVRAGLHKSNTNNDLGQGLSF